MVAADLVDGLEVGEEAEALELEKVASLKEDPQQAAMMWMMLHSTIRDFADQWESLATAVRTILACSALKRT